MSASAVIVEILSERFPLPPAPPPEPPRVPACYRALPAGYPAQTARVYQTLTRLGQATSVELSAVLDLHRGNVDRHLARLRDDGYVARPRRGLHVPLPAEEDCQQAS